MIGNIFSHEKQMIMDLAAIEIQGLVKQTQNQYMIAYANKIGRSLIGLKEPMETSEYIFN